MRIAGNPCEFIKYLAALDSKDVRHAGDLEHVSYLWELLNIDVVEDDLAIMLGDCFLHNRFQDLAGSAPRGGALEDDRDLAIHDSIPVF